MGYWQASDESVNTGNGSNGWPLFDPRFASAMIAQFYDQQPTTAGTNFAQTGGEQPISTLPAWTSLYVTINNVTFLPYVSDGVSEYSQNLSIRDGIVSTSMVWNGVKLNYTVLAHRTIPTLGIVRLEIEPVESAVDVVITDMLDGAGSWRTTFINSSGDVDINELITQVQPDGITNVSIITKDAEYRSRASNAPSSTSDSRMEPYQIWVRSRDIMSPPIARRYPKDIASHYLIRRS